MEICGFVVPGTYSVTVGTSEGLTTTPAGVEVEVGGVRGGDRRGLQRRIRVIRPEVALAGARIRIARGTTTASSSFV